MSESVVDELIGKTLNQRYQIRSLLGKKVGRRTFLALDIITEIPVVIKLLIFDRDFDWQDLKLFEREAETLKSLDHPAIPRYLDYFEFDLTGYRGFGLVQTYIDAQSLDTAINSGRRWSENEVRQISTSLLEILGYLHSQNPPVIHRDIKPSNILIANRSGHYVGDIYLVDFGSVQSLGHRDGGTMTIVGTYGYMPPEQFGGKAFPASDLYSLGATLIYLTTGKHPADLTQDNGTIDCKFDYFSPKYIDWLNLLVEPNLNLRLKNVKEAKLLLEQPDQIIKSNRLLSNDNYRNSKLTFPEVFLTALWTFIMSAIAIPVGGYFLAYILATFNIPAIFVSVIIAAASLFIFSGIWYLASRTQ
jgi:serine/threonine protein kinase